VSYTIAIQRPGDAIITMPGAYHFGINLGFNVAEATNFAVPEWIPKGKEARICMCRPHSVRIDMDHFEKLLKCYENDVANAVKLGFPQLSYRKWTTVQQANRKQLEKEENDVIPNNVDFLTTTEQIVEDQRMAKKKKMFVVEVTRPVANEAATSLTASSSRGSFRKKRKKVKEVEEWRKAIPADVRSLKLHARVLCLLPGKVKDQETEECFAVEITKVADGCVRVHFTGLSKQEDVWISWDSPKLFLDGGIQNYDKHGQPID
jgi:jumonji domain-containing protein 2